MKTLYGELMKAYDEEGASIAISRAIRWKTQLELLKDYCSKQESMCLEVPLQSLRRFIATVCDAEPLHEQQDLPMFLKPQAD